MRSTGSAVEPTGLLAAALAWLAVDPAPDTRAELSELVAAAGAGDAAPLAARFAGRLQFGTAGLRGELGAGPMRMNRVTVRRATAGLVRHLLATESGAAERGVVIGYDARHKSDAFARDAAAVTAGLGMRAHGRGSAGTFECRPATRGHDLPRDVPAGRA